MTKHMYRFYLDPDGVASLSDANQWLLNWADDNDAWIGDPQNVMLEEKLTQEDGSLYWGADWRFHPLIDRDALQSQLNQVFQDNLSWFVAVYHVCEHDDRFVGNCSWDVIYYWPDLVTIPDGIEEKVPDPSSVDEVIQVTTL